MAWNTLTYACGHTEQVQLYGKMDTRERTVAAAEGHDCPACLAAAAKEQAAVDGLPQLTGSDKQIAWADEIRSKLLEQANVMAQKVDEMFARIEAKDFPADRTAEDIAKAVAELTANRTALTKLRSIEKAAWWIDHRSDHINSIVVALRG